MRQRSNVGGLQNTLPLKPWRASSGKYPLWSMWACVRMTASTVDGLIEILRERFARGEIDQREYDERVQHLRDGPGPSD